MIPFGPSDWSVALFALAVSAGLGAAAMHWRQRRWRDDHSFFEQIRDPAFVTGYGRILSANRAAIEQFGYSREQFSGLPVATLLVDPQDEKRFVRALIEGAVTDFALRLKTSAGEVRSFAVTANARFDRHGIVIGCRGLARDVTERVQFINELRRAEQDYRGLFDHAYDAILILDPEDETVLDVNQQACVLYGIPRERFLGRSMGELSVDPGRGRLLLRRTRDEGGAYATFESKQRRGDGTVIDVEINAAEVSYKGRAVIISINRDITQRQELDKARQQIVDVLRLVAAEWRETFDAVQVPIVLLHGNAEILRLNRAAQMLAGRPFLALVGSRADELPGEPWQTAARLARATVDGGDGSSERVTAGEAVWQVSSSPAGAGAQRRAIVVAHDLTLVTKLEASLREREVAAAMGSMVAAVAHEVRNPLFTISAIVDACSARYGGHEGIARYEGPLRDQVQRLSRLMTDLLEYGKPAPIRLSCASLTEALRAAVDDCSVVASQFKVRIEIAVASGLPPAAIDPPRIEQVLQNVIDNAVRHSPSGGIVRVDVDFDDDFFTCTVTDEGPGIAEEDLERVYQPFFSRRRGGTGLGLAIARKIVDAHSGEIAMTNRSDRSGTIVILRLPRRQHLADIEVSAEAS